MNKGSGGLKMVQISRKGNPSVVHGEAKTINLADAK